MRFTHSGHNHDVWAKLLRITNNPSYTYLSSQKFQLKFRQIQRESYYRICLIAIGLLNLAVRTGHVRRISSPHPLGKRKRKHGSWSLFCFPGIESFEICMLGSCGLYPWQMPREEEKCLAPKPVFYRPNVCSFQSLASQNNTVLAQARLIISLLNFRSGFPRPSHQIHTS